MRLLTSILCIALFAGPIEAAEPNAAALARLLRRAAALWYTTEEARVRSGMLFSLANFQDVVLSLATQRPSAEAAGIAAEVVLRWKQPQAEEETHLAALVRHSQDPRVRELAKALSGLRARLPVLYRTGQSVADTLKSLEETERALARLSRPYATELRVQSAGLAQVRSALLPGQALLELRQYRTADFKAGRLGEARIAGLLIRPSGAPVVADLGLVSQAITHWKALEAAGDRESGDRAAVALYQSLFAPFEEALQENERLYLAPDGALHLIPYERLKLVDGRFWIERNDLRIVQTGRDLTREPLPARSDTLLALGGVDFAGGSSTSGNVTTADAELRSATLRTREALGAFKPLEASREEVERIADLYRLARRAPAIVWTLGDAREGRLKSLAETPRVLHLATHGFYLDPGEERHNPLLDSGLALAGANQGLLGKTDPEHEDGLLYSLEALGLDLQGTELIALSACETGRGAVDYSEGVYGLVRSLRVAGATSVLMTLYPVNDGQARDFMIAFYKRWLTQRQSDPAAALRGTKLAYLRGTDLELRDPRVWAPYVLVGR